MKDEIKEILDKLKESAIWYDDSKLLLDYITNLQERKITKEDVNKYFKENMCVSFDKFIENWEEQEEIMKYLQEENDYLKDIVSNTELSNEIKKADKWSKRELYKINYQRLQANKRLREENEDLREENKEAHDFDETMKDIKEKLIARINRQECEIHNLKEENKRLKVELNKYKAKQKLENDIKMQQSYLDYYRTMTRGDK